MNKNLFIVQVNQHPDWLEYPHSFCRLAQQDPIHLTPWHIIEVERVSVHARGLAERYPGRELFPFAYRQDNDDVACWPSGAGEKVFVIHDFASRGWEDKAEFNDVWAWFRSAVDETIAWD